jgi:hypothetical protein
MIFVGQASLRRAIGEFMAHYHEERNYQGLDNTLIRAEPRAAAVPPAAVISVPTARAGSSSMSAHTTAAPSAAKRRAVAAPIPVPLPVTMTTLPVNRRLMFLSLIE